jgi:hypothetical protein
MPVKQISVTLENVPGKLSEVSDYLGENGIDIIALNVMDTADIGAVRMVASDPEKTANVLKSHGYAVNMADVLAVEAPSHPGGLNAILRPLREVSINVDYLYACLGRGEKTVLIMGVDKIPEAIEALRKNWVSMYDEELYSL